MAVVVLNACFFFLSRGYLVVIPMKKPVVTIHAHQLGENGLLIDEKNQKIGKTGLCVRSLLK